LKNQHEYYCLTRETVEVGFVDVDVAAVAEIVDVVVEDEDVGCCVEIVDERIH